MATVVAVSGDYTHRSYSPNSTTSIGCGFVLFVVQQVYNKSNLQQIHNSLAFTSSFHHVDLHVESSVN